MAPLTVGQQLAIGTSVVATVTWALIWFGIASAMARPPAGDGVPPESPPPTPPKDASTNNTNKADDADSSGGDPPADTS